ncbi:MAG TPA: ABC transporter permease [Actinomycetota bacterium]|nr:ABC transporter permease [Actinomycetota bacterium]
MAQVVGEPVLAPEAGGELGGQPSRQVVGRSPWQLFWRRFRRDRFAVVGLVIIGLMAAVALAAPLVARLTGHGPNEVFPDTALNEVGLPVGPSGEFWFGADTAGGDLFVRVLYGARTSLTVAFLATGISLVIGVVLGLVGGYYRRKVDTVISRFIDVVLALPVFFLALGLVAACGGTRQGCLNGAIRPGLLLVSYVIGLFSWPYIARIVRGQVLSLREKEFVEAARAQGSGDLRIMFRDILPNVVAPIIVYTTLIIPNNILFEAALSFLGIGVPPDVPSWGKMLSDAATLYRVAWWTMLFPGLFLFITTLAFNLVGDGLRDALDPRTGR